LVDWLLLANTKQKGIKLSAIEWHEIMEVRRLKVIKTNTVQQNDEYFLRAAPEMVPTTLQSCTPILKYIKHTYTFPLKIFYVVEKPESGRKLENNALFKGVELDIDRKANLIRILISSYHVLKLTLFAFQFGRLWVPRRNANAFALTVMYIPFISVFLLGNVMKFVFEVKKVEIIQFLNKWHRVEEEIYKKLLGSDILGMVGGGPAQIFRSLSYNRGFLVLFVTVLMAFMLTDPSGRKDPAYLYSLVDADT